MFTQIYNGNKRKIRYMCSRERNVDAVTVLGKVDGTSVTVAAAAVRLLSLKRIPCFVLGQ